jgi:hypothetical protein
MSTMWITTKSRCRRSVVTADQYQLSLSSSEMINRFLARRPTEELSAPPGTGDPDSPMLLPPPGVPKGTDGGDDGLDW